MDTYTTLSNEQLEDLRQSIYTFAESFKIDMQDILRPVYTQIEQQRSVLLYTLQQTNDITVSLTNQLIQQLRDILFSPENQAIYELIEDHLFLDEDMEDLPIPIALDIINEYYITPDNGIRLTKDDITLAGLLASAFNENMPLSVSMVISIILFLSYFAKLDD